MIKTVFKPLPGWAVLDPLEEKDMKPQSDSDVQVVVPEETAAKDSMGIVVAVGEDYIIHEGDQKIEAKCPVKIGDKIIYKNVTGQKYLDLNTSTNKIFVKWHPEPYWSDIISKIA